MLLFSGKLVVFLFHFWLRGGEEVVLDKIRLLQLTVY